MKELTPAQLDALRLIERGPAYKVATGWAQPGRFGRVRVAVMGALFHGGYATTTSIKGKLAVVITAAGRNRLSERKSA